MESQVEWHCTISNPPNVTMREYGGIPSFVPASPTTHILDS
ncbi:hypothetical protein OROHE_010399 [Orobanche hederae]